MSNTRKTNIEEPKILYTLSEDESSVALYIDNHTDKSEYLYDMHYDLEIGIVYSGKIERIYNDYRTILSPGMVWLNGIWEPHGYSLIEVPCKIVMFFFKPELLFNIDLGLKNNAYWYAPFTVPPHNRPQLDEVDMVNILHGLERIERLKNTNAQNLNIATRLMMLEILSSLIKKKQALDERKFKTYGYFDIEPAIELVFSNKKSISDNAAAEACMMSRRTFTNRFKSTMHISFAKFCLQFRLRQASVQLKNGNEKISKIAFEHGFRDTSHFYKCFNRYYGCTPVEFRKKTNTNFSL